MCECCSGGKGENKYKKFAFLNDDRHDHDHDHDHHHDHDHEHDHSADSMQDGHVHGKD